MNDNRQFRMYAEVKGTLREFLKRAEGTDKASAENPHAISVVRNGASGISIGDLQMDLSKNQDLAAKLDAIASAKGIERPEGITNLDLAAESTKINSLQDDAVKSHLARIVNTPEGQAVLKDAENKKLNQIKRAVENACGQAGPNAYSFCRSPDGQRELAAYVHQYGTGNIEKLKSYLRGEEVTLGQRNETDPGTAVQLKEPLTVEGFRSEYRNSTLWGQDNPRPAKTRDNNVDAANRDIPAIPPPPAPAPRPPAAKPEQRGDADTGNPDLQSASSEPEPKQTSEQAALPREQPQVTTSAFAAMLPRKPVNLLEMPSAMDPTLARFVGTSSTENPGQYGVPPLMPDNRRTGIPPYGYDPAPQPPADPYNLKGLLAALTGQPTANPIGDLLGSGAKRTDPKSAVKLFQSTINNFNRPENFDWNWSTNGKIDVDGELGPQTMAGFGRAVEKAGPEGFARKFAVDQFRQYATRLDNGIERYENLPGALDSSIGRLDRNASASFQDYLNVARENLAPHVRYPALKRDGWVGPKTTDAFKTALYAMGPKNIADDLEGIFGV